MALTITPIQGVGAEITGIDIKALSDADFAAIQTAFAALPDERPPEQRLWVCP